MCVDEVTTDVCAIVCECRDVGLGGLRAEQRQAVARSAYDWAHRCHRRGATRRPGIVTRNICGTKPTGDSSTISTVAWNASAAPHSACLLTNFLQNKPNASL